MFYYELHAHTNAASLCSIVEPEEYVKFYMEKGFSGMVITDHFYHGNTSVERYLEWEDFVEQFCQGYYRAKAEGDKVGFTVFFGFEQKFSNGTDEYLVYGISPEWLKSHPEIRDMDRPTFFKTIREAGGFIIQAHPFRQRVYVPDIRLSLDYVDAVEVLNLGDRDKFSRRSYEYAKNLGLPMTAGSDIHSTHRAYEVAGVATEKKLESIEELIEEIRERRAIPVPTKSFEHIKSIPLDEDVDLPVLALYDGELSYTENYFAKKL